MSSKAVIIFPYGGYENNKKLEWYFWWTVDACKEIDTTPVVVLCRDTVIRDQATSFVADDRCAELEVVQTWSVDTCQTWLAGWGHVLDNYPEADRIILLPGDINYVYEEDAFYDKLRAFIRAREIDIAIGDFNTGDRFSAKGLVDIYGTYPLLANWFPQISKRIRSLPLLRPRSEFLNIRAATLKHLLIRNRNFAYEQTINILIKCWNHEEKNWVHDISVFPLGTLADEKSFRHYRGCIDQIERIERMLSLLWREIKEPGKQGLTETIFEDEYTVFSDEYDKLRTKSKGIMETARTTLRALLGV